MSQQLFLLSCVGERHEDRLPQGIFSSLDAALGACRKKYLKEYKVKPTDTVRVVTPHPPRKGDYGQCIEAWVGVDKNGMGENCIAFIIDTNFYLDDDRPKNA